jgi:uncharacterized protein with GYD domain
MLTYVVLAKFTEKGIAGFKESPDRAKAFVIAKGAEFGLNVKTLCGCSASMICLLSPRFPMK